MIESDRVVLLNGAPEVVYAVEQRQGAEDRALPAVPDRRCGANYAGAGDVVRFVRVGTLDKPDRLPPDIHIFTSSKQPWVCLPRGTPAVKEYYDREKYWPKASLKRRLALLARTAISDDLARLLRSRRARHRPAGGRAAERSAERTLPGRQAGAGGPEFPPDRGASYASARTTAPSASSSTGPRT
jgi:hypothetical protein